MLTVTIVAIAFATRDQFGAALEAVPLSYERIYNIDLNRGVELKVCLGSRSIARRQKGTN